MNARTHRARRLVRIRSRINRGMARRRRQGLWEYPNVAFNDLD